MNATLKYLYSDQEQKQLLKSMVVLVDSREKENKHVTDYFDKKGVAWKKATLSVGDYSILLPKNEDLGIIRESSFQGLFAIERKNSLDELSGNFTEGRERFSNEFFRAKDAKLLLLIENGSFDKMINHEYRSQLSEKAFIASLFSFQHRFNLSVNFIEKKNAGMFIHTNCYYFLKECLSK